MNLSRQRDIMHFRSDDYPLLIIGAGGIGSNAAYVAACTGFENITVYEPDVVDEENIAPQLYSVKDLGHEKVAALSDGIFFFTGVRINERNYLYHRQPETAKIVLVAVDSMPARRRIWKQNRISGKRWWIDGRMGGTLCSVFCVDLQDPVSVAAYERSLESPDGDLPCGRKATAPLTKGTIQGMIGTALYHIVNGSKPPFRQLFDMETITFLAMEAK